MPRLTITVPHCLPQEEALKRSRELLSVIRSKSEVPVHIGYETWEEYEARFGLDIVLVRTISVKINGTIWVFPGSLILNAELPMSAALLDGNLIRETTDKITRQAEALLAPAPAAPQNTKPASAEKPEAPSKALPKTPQPMIVPEPVIQELARLYALSDQELIAEREKNSLVAAKAMGDIERSGNHLAEKDRLVLAAYSSSAIATTARQSLCHFAVHFRSLRLR